MYRNTGPSFEKPPLGAKQYYGNGLNGHQALLPPVWKEASSTATSQPSSSVVRQLSVLRGHRDAHAPGGVCGARDAETPPPARARLRPPAAAAWMDGRSVRSPLPSLVVLTGRELFTRRNVSVVLNARHANYFTTFATTVLARFLQSDYLYILLHSNIQRSSLTFLHTYLMSFLLKKFFL